MRKDEIVTENTIDLTPLVEPDKDDQLRKAKEYLSYADALLKIEKQTQGAKAGEKRSLHQMKQIKPKNEGN